MRPKLGLVTVAVAIALVTAGDTRPSVAQTTTLVESQRLTGFDVAAGDVFGRSVAVSGGSAVIGADRDDTSGSDAGAAYVFEHDGSSPGNWSEIQKLIASDSGSDFHFGEAVAISGDSVIVGAPRARVGQFNLACCGAAYVFQRDGGGPDNWGQIQKLETPIGCSPGCGTYFGSAVSLDNDTAVVGSYGDHAQPYQGAGAAYIYQADGGGYMHSVKKLVASDPMTADEFGRSVSVNGDTIAVGADLQDTAGINAGAVYIFQRDQGGPNNWGQINKIVASDARPEGRFGQSVAVRGTTIVVGAYGDAAYVFERDQGGMNNWGEIKKLTPSDPLAGSTFGYSVTTNGSMVMVGDPSATVSSGAAYVYWRDQGGTNNWGQVKRLSTSASSGAFGYSVGIDQGTALIGALGEDSSTGAAYMFVEQPDIDEDTVADLTDNCPGAANTAQANTDGDPSGDACDNCPASPNPDQANDDGDQYGDGCDYCPTTHTLWVVPFDDNPDCDGFPRTTWQDGRGPEAFMGTNPEARCSATSATNDEFVDAWPVDLNDDRRSNLSDIVTFGTNFNKVIPDPAYTQRYDLNASGSVNLSDIIVFGPFFNRACAP